MKKLFLGCFSFNVISLHLCPLFNKIVNPIQALMVNRLLCMKFESVKVLWLYDKKNCLTNTVLLWVLMNGIVREGVFYNRDSIDVFESLRKQVYML